MLKQILPLLFTFVFSINLFAESHDIHREISDIKLQIQEIKLLDARDDREKKIEKLETDIKKLEEEFNKNNVDKKEIDGKLEKTKDIIERQDLRIGDLDFTLNFYGILITILFAIGSVATYKISSNNALEEAQKELKDWVKTKADKQFKSTVDNYLLQIEKKSEELLKNIKDKGTNLHQETKDLNEKYRKEIDLLQNGKYTKEEKDNLNKEVEEIKENKKEEDYTFNDRYKLFLSKYTNNKFEDALSIIQKILTLNLDDKDLVKILFAKGATLGQLGKSEEEIEVYDELIERFKYSKESAILKQLASALFSKGVKLGQLEKSEEAIEVYDELIERFQNLKESALLEKVAKALINKGVILGKLRKSKEAIEVYDEVIKKFETSKESAILEKVATALYNKGTTLGKSGKLEKAIEVYDEVIKRFETSKESSILEQVASALLNKIETNLILGNISSKKDLDLYFNLIKDDKEQLSQFEMLKIFEKARNSNQEEEIKEWQIKFKDTKLVDWSFDELKTWVETLENEPKERILRYIDIFEKYNEKVK